MFWLVILVAVLAAGGVGVALRRRSGKTGVISDARAMDVERPESFGGFPNHH